MRKFRLRSLFPIRCRYCGTTQASRIGTFWGPHRFLDTAKVVGCLLGLPCRKCPIARKEPDHAAG